MVLMVAPAGSTFLTRLLLVSAIYRLPSLPAAILMLGPNWAWSGGPPSPLNPGTVLPPAQVLIFPSVVTRRTAWDPGDMLEYTESTKYTFPAPSTATCSGNPRLAAVAGPPSPPVPGPV